jgi:hypothetical protein
MGDLIDDLIWIHISKGGKRFYTLSSPDVPRVDDAEYTYAWTKSIGNDLNGVLFPTAKWKELIDDSTKKTWARNSNGIVPGRTFGGWPVDVQTSRAGKRPNYTDFGKYFEQGQVDGGDEAIKEKLRGKGWDESTFNPSWPVPKGMETATCWRTVAAQTDAEALYPTLSDTEYVRLSSADVLKICPQRHGEGVFISETAFKKLKEPSYPWPLGYEGLVAIRGDDGGLCWITLQEPLKIDWASIYTRGTSVADGGAFARSIDPDITIYILPVPSRVTAQELQAMFTAARERSKLFTKFEMITKRKDDYFLVSSAHPVSRRYS